MQKKRIIFSQYYTTRANIAAGAKSSQQFITQADQDIQGFFTGFYAFNPDSAIMAILPDDNPANVIPIPPNGGSVSIDNMKFANFTLKNIDGATEHTAGLIHIVAFKEVDFE